MKQASLFLSILASFLMSVFVISCSDESQLDLDRAGSYMGSESESDSDSTKAQDSITGGSFDTDSSYSNGSAEAYSSSDLNGDNAIDLYDSIEALPVSDDDKQELMGFVTGLLSTTGLDMSALISAISGGTLSDVGIDNELVQEFLVLLLAGSLTGGGAIAFIEILKIVSKYMEENNNSGSGSGSDSGISNLLNSSLFSNFLSSGSIDSFVQNFLGDGLKSLVLDRISGVFQNLHQ